MVNNKRVIVLLPMREHSLRVQNKNMHIVSGKPLYHYIMETLLNSKYIDDIYVNTDSYLIKEDIKNYFSCVQIIDRPENLRKYEIGANELIEYDLSQIPSKTEDIFLQTHATNPLVKVQTIDDALLSFELYRKEGYDSLFSCTEKKKRFYNSNYQALNHDPNQLIPTQDLDPLYEENSLFYLFSKESFLKKNNRIGSKAYIYQTNFFESLDIDDQFEMDVFESIKK